jgi:hypothetical protein
MLRNIMKRFRLRALSFFILFAACFSLANMMSSCRNYRSVITSGGLCDSLKWERVYRPNRLKILRTCVTVTGKIISRESDTDGDEYFLLKLDPGQDTLLWKKNRSRLFGNLQLEVVCANKVTRKEAKGICNGYVNDVILPNAGDRVRVTGTHVVDKHNYWTEIHPVTKIERL